MRTFTAITFTLASASLVLAQNNTSSSSSVNIPEGTSQVCKDFLNNLNTNSAISSCLNGLITATDTTNGTSTSDMLANLCSPTFNTLCDPTTIRSSLADFGDKCGADMAPADGSAGKQEIINLYDTLYLIVPLKGAMCSKNSAGKYCVNEMNGSSSQKRDIYGRADSDTPDLASYSSSGLPYMFVTPSSNQDVLCSECTGQIMNSYVGFETVTPYALGIANSPSLSGQVPLWDKISQCSNGLANQIMGNSTGDASAAGGAAGVRVGMTGVVAALMSAVVATVALF
jgi:hypothetical protein